MQKTILVLTNTKDGVHSDVVISKLRERGAPVFRLDMDTISGGECLVAFHAEDSLTFRFSDLRSGLSLSASDIGSVWYRRPNILDIKVKDVAQRKQGESDTRAFLDGLWLILPHVFWLSGLPQLERARRKILQLSLAKDLGFLIPRTLVTNDPETAKLFIHSCGRSIVFKCLGESWLDSGNGFTIPTTLLTDDHLKHLEMIKVVPALFQALVHKEYDVRVTVVGQKVFAAKIDSQADPLTRIDWRHPERIATLGYSTVQLPDDLSQKCVQLVSRLGLVFGAIDFAVDGKGNHFFLEVNPNGQWYWLEHFTGQLISEAIVDMLISERR